MKKLLIGLLALGSISSYAQEVKTCDVSELNILTDNELSEVEVNDIKVRLQDKGYNLDNLGSDSGLRINIGIQREVGFNSAQRYVGFNQGKTKVGTFINRMGTELHNLSASVKDAYSAATVKAFRISDLSSCENLDGKIAECDTVSSKTRTSLYNLTPDSEKHDQKVIEWAIRKLPVCK